MTRPWLIAHRGASGLAPEAAEIAGLITNRVDRMRALMDG